MKFREGTAKAFLLGNISGAILCAVILFGLAALSVYRHGRPMNPGYVGDILVDISKQPREGYDWSLDISRNKNYLFRLGKRTDAQTADNCQLYDPQGKPVVYMAWDDPEVGPGLIIKNSTSIIANAGFMRDGSKNFVYGPYGLPSEKIKNGDVGYVDLDFDGQFDLKEVFGADGTVQKSYIFLNRDWKEMSQLGQSKSEALINQSDGSIKYTFESSQGWTEKKE